MLEFGGTLWLVVRSGGLGMEVVLGGDLFERLIPDGDVIGCGSSCIFGESGIPMFYSLQRK